MEVTVLTWHKMWRHYNIDTYMTQDWVVQLEVGSLTTVQIVSILPLLSHFN